MGRSDIQQAPEDACCHSDPTAGHLGRTQTFYKVYQNVFTDWPGIFNDAEKMVCTLITLCLTFFFFYI